MNSRFFFLFILFSSLFFKTTYAETTPKICMILDKAGKDDHGFNESAYKGFKSALSEQTISNESRVFEAKDDAQIEQATRSFILGKCALIFAVGVNVAEPLKKFVDKYPEQKFAMIDYVVPGKNVRSIIFREDQGGFLIGAIAAIKSKTQKIGLIAGMDIPLIERFKLGYEAGARYINPKIKVTTAFVGVSVDGWNNPAKASEIALSQFNQGVDIIFQAAGGSGIGVFDAAEKMNYAHKTVSYFAIGADSNQNWIKPKMILTSMLKGLGDSVLASIQDLKQNKFTAGTVVYGVENGGVDWALDKYNKSNFTDKEVAKINAIKVDIGNGKIQVPDYYKLK
ncbi:MAG: BMP family ABC transporter substrate-binding protein [Bdellovibrionota bacterium]